MVSCKECSSTKIVKAGFLWGKQRYKCKDCGHKFTRMEKAGKPEWIKLFCVFLYCHGISMNALAKMFGVHTSSVMRWIRDHAQSTYKKHTPQGNALVLELDEMWHFLHSKKTNTGSSKYMTVCLEGLSTGSVVVAIPQP